MSSLLSKTVGVSTSRTIKGNRSRSHYEKLLIMQISRLRNHTKVHHRVLPQSKVLRPSLRVRDTLAYTIIREKRKVPQLSLIKRHHSVCPSFQIGPAKAPCCFRLVSTAQRHQLSMARYAGKCFTTVPFPPVAQADRFATRRDLRLIGKNPTILRQTFFLETDVQPLDIYNIIYTTLS